ncbi:MAG TPA: ribose 5-phosphate isomerase B [Desulfobacterales bacterium]|nr:ribose 5-phosphate isomerase B [Desulfobacterales bacterium]
MLENKNSIVIGSDHAAYPLKEKIKTYLIECGMKIEDVGTCSEESVDYTDFGARVAVLVSAGKFQRGILLCGTGIGMSMVANRFPRVRAALCSDLFTAIMSRRHNNSNILVMGGRVIGEALALEMVKAWLETAFEGGRHQLRIEKFDRIDQTGLGKEFLKSL